MLFAPRTFNVVGVAHDIDRVTAAAGGLAADRAIAAHVRLRRVRVDAERDGAAVTGPFELHRRLLWIGRSIIARTRSVAHTRSGPAYLCRGSNASRSPSPSRLNDSTSRKIDNPGQIAIHGALSM